MLEFLRNWFYRLKFTASFIVIFSLAKENPTARLGSARFVSTACASRREVATQNVSHRACLRETMLRATVNKEAEKFFFFVRLDKILIFSRYSLENVFQCTFLFTLFSLSFADARQGFDFISAESSSLEEA